MSRTKLPEIVVVQNWNGKYALYDRYYQMIIHQCQPLYSNKATAMKEARIRNKEYAELGITETDRYNTQEIWSKL